MSEAGSDHTKTLVQNWRSYAGILTLLLRPEIATVIDQDHKLQQL